MAAFDIPAEQLEELAREAGFDRAGIAATPSHASLASSPGPAESPYFDTWVEQGRAGEMEYLKRCDDAGQLLRSSLHAAFPWAQSVIVCAVNYNSEAPHSVDPAAAGSGWIARYAWSGRAGEQVGDPLPSDYHDVLLPRLRTLETRLKQRLGEFESRAYVDTGPLVERVYAERAGIGWTGKNTCILNQQIGSWLLLGVIVTSLPVTPAATPQIATDRCGTCRRCIDACPTGALVMPHEMDASLCISYLTIEKRGTIPEELRAPMGRQIFGCDICQDVCPWNRKAPVSTDTDMAARSALVNPALEWLAGLDAQAFHRLFRGSPVKRAKHAGLQRNVAIAMGNSGEEKFLSKLQEWTVSGDPVLAETAQWAIEAIRQGGAQAAEEQVLREQVLNEQVLEGMASEGAERERPPCVGEAVR